MNNESWCVTTVTFSQVFGNGKFNILSTVHPTKVSNTDKVKFTLESLPK